MSGAVDLPPACGLTIVRSKTLLLAKTVSADGSIKGYDRVKTVDLQARCIVGLGEIHALLADLGARPGCAVMRGGIADPERARGVRRLLHGDPGTGELPTITEVPREWIALDVDGIELPSGVDPLDLAACAGSVVRHLPEAFQGAARIVQATASHGIKPGARMRLWYWCDRPLTGAECKRWLKGVPVDKTVFGAAQVIYTAAPVFVGCADPLPRRLAMLPGAASVVTPPPEALAPRAPALAALGNDVRAAAPRVRSGRSVLWAMARAITRIKAAPEGDRHSTAVAQAWGLARFLAADDISAAELKDVIADAIVQAGKTAEEGVSIAAWALAHAGAQGTAQ